MGRSAENARRAIHLASLTSTGVPSCKWPVSFSGALAHHLREGDVLAGIRRQGDRQIRDLLWRSTDELALLSGFRLRCLPIGPDAREVRPSERLTSSLGVAGEVADTAGSALVQVNGTALGHCATKGATLGALLPLLAWRRNDAVDGAGVPDDQVTWLRDELCASAEVWKVAGIALHKHGLVADGLVPVRAKDVLRCAVVTLSTPVHGSPPSEGIREVNRPVLIVLVPAKTLVRVH
mmetsp:Transcript_20527/g.44832  ORF Transcript_20527/g.44832 Transcript_20527/m.44832 type:complete len:236 (+) Transcript_20527:115-822(+)